MTDVRVQTEIVVQGEKAGDCVSAYAHGHSAWLQVICGETGPKVVLFFGDGLEGRRQVMALIQQLEVVALRQLEQVEADAAAPLV